MTYFHVRVSTSMSSVVQVAAGHVARTRATPVRRFTLLRPQQHTQLQLPYKQSAYVYTMCVAELQLGKSASTRCQAYIAHRMRHSAYFKCADITIRPPDEQPLE